MARRRPPIHRERTQREQVRAFDQPCAGPRALPPVRTFELYERLKDGIDPYDLEPGCRSCGAQDADEHAKWCEARHRRYEAGAREEGKRSQLWSE